MRHRTLAALLVTLACLSPAEPGAQSPAENAKVEPKRPAFSLKGSVGSGMVPIRVQFAAELRGGDDDFQEYYCPTVEWFWGDGTSSEASEDCAPYEPGKIEIRRRYTVSHMYKRPGRVNVQIRLKQKDRVVGSASTVVQLVGNAF